ncbi:MAG: LysM peptidoglycan-binding domain-containing protein [Candidatus Omnitrophica bacterium]|nr:LysM peptidoglycan-binding domain-containing protein [Candidatus Omnitrophota bacterium]
MPKKMMSFGLAFLMVSVLTGCAGKAGVRVQSYMADEERVDQSMEGGNYGYFSGTPVPEDRSQFKKTRRIYVLEVTKDVEDVEDVEVVVPQRSRPEITAPAVQRGTIDVPEWAQTIEIPDFDEGMPPDQVAEPTVTGFVDYEIQKDDTLQKISKKFYDSYSKWPKIYEVNKDVIGDPNAIKPGVTIRIPVAQ